MARHCPKCQHPMKAGVFGESVIARWHDIKDKTDDIPSSKTDQRDYEFPDKRKGQMMTAYKCTWCGYVELFVEED